MCLQAVNIINQPKPARLQVRHDEAEAQAAAAAESEDGHARNDGCATGHGAMTGNSPCTAILILLRAVSGRAICSKSMQGYCQIGEWEVYE